MGIFSCWQQLAVIDSAYHYTYIAVSKTDTNIAVIAASYITPVSGAVVKKICNIFTNFICGGSTHTPTDCLFRVRIVIAVFRRISEQSGINITAIFVVCKCFSHVADIMCKIGR